MSVVVGGRCSKAPQPLAPATPSSSSNRTEEAMSESYMAALVFCQTLFRQRCAVSRVNACVGNGYDDLIALIFAPKALKREAPAGHTATMPASIRPNTVAAKPH